MKNLYLTLASFASLGLTNVALATNAPQAQVPLAATPSQTASQPISSQFTPAQLAEIEKVIGDYLAKNPEVVMTSFQAGMEKQQKETVAKMEKAVAENKDKIFNDRETPVAGNPKGSQTLVVFMDPNCGYCKKFDKELDNLLKTNKSVKVIFKDIPIMGDASILIVKAMLAAKEQGKYEQLQKAVFASDKRLTKKQLLKLASSVGIDTKKLESTMKSKAIETQIDQNLELAKTLGINGTPTLIVGESKVLPGYVSAEELNKMLQDSSSLTPTAETKPESSGKAS